MEHEPRSETFQYSYSAQQQEEVLKIRSKYVPKEESKIEQLRRLDASVTKKGTAAALIVGVLSTLVMGVGMCCCLVWGETLFIPGIIIGLLGIAGMALAHPIYSRITQMERERIAPEVIRLTDELMQ